MVKKSKTTEGTEEMHTEAFVPKHFGAQAQRTFLLDGYFSFVFQVGVWIEFKLDIDRIVFLALNF